MAIREMARLSPAVREILEDDLELSTKDVEQAVTLPPSCYTSEEWFEFEKRAIFMREWLCVGRVEQVANVGDFFTLTLVDEPLIVVRSSEQEIRVMSAVCRHRAMVITVPGNLTTDSWSQQPPETTGNCDQFKCPYHFWAYDLEGKLVGAPEMHRTPGFDTSEVRLPAFQTEIWNGFIFVNFDAEAAPLAPRLTRLTDTFANWHFDDLVDVEPSVEPNLPWNWKVMHENSIESYHADRLHAGLHGILPSAGVLPTLYEENEAALIFPIKATEQDYALNPTFKPLLPTISTLTEEERWIGKFALIPPTLLIGLNTDSALYRIVHPTAPGMINITFGNLIQKKHLRPKRLKEVRKMIRYGMVVLGRQDSATNAAVQKGLRSKWAPRSRYAWQEDSLPAFNRWLVTRYKRAAYGE